MSQAVKFGPIEGITKARELQNVIFGYAADLESVINEILADWSGLGKVGGQREDHAAKLLGQLRPILDRMSKFAQTASRQIADMEANPFGD